MKRGNKVLGSCLVLLSMFYATSALAEVYKWIDEEGNLHFSQVKPTDAQTEEVEVDYVKPNEENASRMRNKTEAFKKAGEERQKAEQETVVPAKDESSSDSNSK